MKRSMEGDEAMDVRPQSLWISLDINKKGRSTNTSVYAKRKSVSRPIDSVAVLREAEIPNETTREQTMLRRTALTGEGIYTDMENKSTFCLIRCVSYFGSGLGIRRKP